MMVTFISQCEKKALKRTRRVLDAFANRIGDKTWQTIITGEGLNTVKILLRKTATRNTAVSCHWIRSRSRSELVWIVGNRRKFNPQGIVPVNSTQLDLLHRQWEKGWHTTEIIAIAAAIAGLFHDIGKANNLFQDKLTPNKGNRKFEPYRHEWVSLRLFQAFVGEGSDEQWLTNLAHVDSSMQNQILGRFVKDSPHSLESSTFDNPFDKLPPFAHLVAWLVVSHHRLPVYPEQEKNQPGFSKADKWLEEDFDDSWNSWNSHSQEWDEQTLEANWAFSKGTPFISKTWQEKAKQLSKRALRCLALNGNTQLNQRLVMHLSRLVLMLADHYYSKMEPNVHWQDLNYAAHANTNKQRQPKQKLDEHSVGVARYAYLFSRLLPHLREELSPISSDRVFIKGVDGGAEFRWQDMAYKVAQNAQPDTEKRGFFGINMASTGKGKTIANARIMYALSNKQEGCRFNVALGLRTLTLQTGQMFRERLGLDSDEVATFIGSQAIQLLLDKEPSQVADSNNDEAFQITQQGSESLAIDNDDNGEEVLYDTIATEGLIDRWFKDNVKYKKLLHAPVLVSTIDHLTPATEGVRGGRQIVPMLRMLTSDLIIDEPDELDLNDLPALSRLVNWAGMLGARVLISTATLPPALAYALFEAYLEGRKAFHDAVRPHDLIKPVICGWFDEFDSVTTEKNNFQDFKGFHDSFVKNRVAKLNQVDIKLQRAKLIEVPKIERVSPVKIISQVIRDNALVLHGDHHQLHESGKKISLGLVRMANINPLVAVARCLLTIPVPDGSRIHYCIYHSQYPLAQRAYIERKLDQALNRKDPEAIWEIPEVKSAIYNCSEKNHVFIVLATAVAEVGRDHDYDWVIAEPSSMRSIIQLAGRIQRHRKQAPSVENLYILSKNFRALTGKAVVFTKPGFEEENRKLLSHDLHDILDTSQYAEPCSAPCIQLPENLQREKGPYSNLVTMEHVAYCEELLGLNQKEENARVWWKTQATWCAEIQRRQPFRKSALEQAYCLCLEEGCEPVWKIKNERTRPVEYAEVSNIASLDLPPSSNRNQFWFKIDIQNIYPELVQQLAKPMEEISYQFGEIRLRVHKNDGGSQWRYHPSLGVFAEINMGGF